jgi:hypothetical protein
LSDTDIKNTSYPSRSNLGTAKLYLPDGKLKDFHHGMTFSSLLCVQAKYLPCYFGTPLCLLSELTQLPIAGLVIFHGFWRLETMKRALSCSPLSLPFTLSIILLGSESSLDWFLNKHRGNAIRKKFVK